MTTSRLDAPAQPPAPPLGHAVDVPHPPAGDVSWHRWEIWALLSILAAAAVLYSWDLAEQGWANAYYAAAVQTGAGGWKAMFFGSLDPGNALATDKPPVALWVMSASVRVFGLSTASLVVPQVVQALATIAVLHRTVRLHAGAVAATLAALILATTPVFLVLARSDDPDVTLTLLAVGAAYATLRHLRDGSMRWLVAAGALVGAAFLTKWMAGLLVVPAIALVVLLRPGRPLATRVRHLAAAAAAAAVTGGWWVLVLLLLPAGSHPYEDASGGSVLNLIAGRNGFSRIVAEGPVVANPVSGAPGPARLFLAPFDGQIGWLLPLAALAAVTPYLLGAIRQLTGRRDGQRVWSGPAPGLAAGGHAFWACWLVVTAAIFSGMAGPMHPYYTVLMAPAVAALVATWATDLWRARGRVRRWMLPVAAAAVALTCWYAATTLGRYPHLLLWSALLLGICACLVAVASAVLRRVKAGLALLAVAALVAGPATFAAATDTHPVVGADALAGPGSGRTAIPPYPAALVTFLEAHAGQRTWAAAMPTATPASRLQLQSGLPVLTLGGFTGSVASPTLEQVQSWVAHGRLRYLVLGGPYLHRRHDHALAGSQTDRIVGWAVRHGCTVTIPGEPLQVLDLTGTGCA